MFRAIIISRFVLLISLLSILSANLCAAQDLIKIGLNYPETGPYAKQGLDQRRAADIAVDEINASGGILGKKIQLVYRDSKSNAKIAKANAIELYDKENVPMIFGGSSSAAAIATGEVALQKNRLFFGTLTYSTETTGEYGHRHIFRECYDAYSAGKVLSEHLKKNFAGQKYFYITANYTWGWTTESVLRGFTNTLDTTVHPEVLTELGTKDFTEALQEAKESKAGVLVLSLFGRDMEIAVRQAYEMGLKNKMQIIVPSLNDDMAQGAGPEAMEGVIGTLPWIWNVPYTFMYPKGIAFVKKFEDKHQRYPTTSGASAYVIMHQYKEAVERAKTFETKAVIKSLEGHTYTGLKDEQQWRAWDHQSVQTVYAVQCKPAVDVKKSAYQQDYFKIINVMKGYEAAVDKSEWVDIRQMVSMRPELDEFNAEL
jgi:ABC-type branched-subunit amino acid transport system substrate-binding protein